MHKMAEEWDKRYAGQVYVYGESPNEYLKEQLGKLQPGKILFPGEGEGRNAVYAASRGWKVWAYDISSEGKKKAEQLSKKQGVKIDYSVGELQEMEFEKEQFDAIALIYTHFPPQERTSVHKLLDSLLRPGGVIIAEVFSKNHIRFQAKNSNAGGPRDINFLYAKEEIRADFDNYEIIELEENVIELSEGLYHSGTGSVIRFTGRKL